MVLTLPVAGDILERHSVTVQGSLHPFRDPGNCPTTPLLEEQHLLLNKALSGKPCF